MKAEFIVHTPNGPVAACEDHTRAIRGLFGFLGCHVGITPAQHGEECSNCKNEAAKRGETTGEPQA